MSSLASIVSSRGPIKAGDPDGADVLVLQQALVAAGYRVATDQAFGPRTDQVVRQFQTQHGLKSDGIVGPITAALLDEPHAVLLASATPLTVPTSGDFAVPHDDTASLLAVYGKPWEDDSLIAHVPCPWKLYYDGQAWPHAIPFHKKGAPALAVALDAIWSSAGGDDSSVLTHVRNYSGSYNYRPIRGSSRLSCHAFGVAIDFDADKLPLGKGVAASEMPEAVVTAFKQAGFFWGGDFTGRKDPQHFQLAHE